MNQELSRVERNKIQRSQRFDRFKQLWGKPRPRHLAARQRLPLQEAVGEAALQPLALHEAPVVGVSLKDSSVLDIHNKQPMTRMERSRTAEQEGSEELPDAYPSRAELFPSRRLRVSKWFLNFLSTLFMLITAVLVWWGIQGAPPVKTLLPEMFGE
ncbi:hypothetical protein [Paenibacillus massiliensis]|uniref:hypothetical protein n=1 Tax=Paenibacillus massiliensis TaxID=225917 RepID=UPI0004720428|nr:hypothetical protein [Paenibacillus massiliensis]